MANNLEANIVVIGSGASGLSAAVAAAEKGSTSIVVLEKLKFLGGNSGLNTGHHGLFAAESPVQKRRKIATRRDDYFKMAMDWAHWRINPKIIRAFIDKSGDTIRWLEDKGIEFVPINPLHSPYHALAGEPNESGPKLIGALHRDCKSLGIQIYIDTPANKILTGSNGEITGVLAEIKGKESKITTKSVIIASGGFAGNKKLLKKYCLDYHDNMQLVDSLPHQGDGLLMALSVGAATEGLGTMHMMGPGSRALVLLEVEGQSQKIPVGLIAIIALPYMLWVHKRGERFADETLLEQEFGNSYHVSANAAVRQTDNVTYSLFDSIMVSTIGEQGLTQWVTEDIIGKKLMGLEPELRKLADKGLVKISNSWDKIAEWMGADRKVLSATIDEYNAACDKGYDPVFNKESEHLVSLRTPPYYAIRCQTNLATTIGGIKINERMEVLDTRDNAIPGLYAVGVDTGGWEGPTYCPFLRGSALGFAFNSGRIAGENAAKFISRK